MHSELYSLSRLFTENLFRIPDYQRGYSWQAKELQDFWDDIELLPTGKDHYTGVLTLEEVSKTQHMKWEDDLWIIESKRHTPFYVVDGQQRLTTILIIIQCILEELDDNAELNYSSKGDIRRKFIFESRDGGISRSYIFGYEKDNPSYNFLKTKIFLEPPDCYSIGEETIYTHNLLRAKSFFHDKLCDAELVTLESTFSKITQHFLFNIYVISGAIDVFVAFETMNNRGKPLSHLELLKNRLIYLSTLLRIDKTERDDLRKSINEGWKTAYHFLGRNKERPLDDDAFLRTQFLLYAAKHIGEIDNDPESRYMIRMYRSGPTGEYYKRYLLERYFSTRNLEGTPQDNGVERPIVAYPVDAYTH